MLNISRKHKRYISVTSSDTPPPEPTRQLYRVKTDREIAEQQIAIPGHGQFWEPGRTANWRDGFPTVFWLFGSVYVQFTEAQQRLAWDMLKDSVDSVKKFAVVYGNTKAFMNGTGYGDPSDPRRNYITGEDLSARLPRWDKIRVCADATLAGYERTDIMAVTVPTTFTEKVKSFFSNLIFGNPFKQGIAGLVQTEKTIMQEIDMLIVDYIPENNIPTWEELKPKKWLYFEAVSSTPTGDTTPFPQGVYGPIYIPLIAKAEIRFPLAALEKL